MADATQAGRDLTLRAGVENPALGDIVFETGGVERSRIKADGSALGILAQAPPMVSGRYYFVPNVGVTSSNAALGISTMRASPFFAPNPVTLSRIGAEITAAGDVGSKLRLGIYGDDGTGRPGTLILDAGTIAGDSVTVQEITIAQAIPAGLLWAVGCVQVVTTTQPTVRTNQNGGVTPADAGLTIPAAGGVAFGFSAVGVAGAFPATFVVVGSAGVTMPRIFVKVA